MDQAKKDLDRSHELRARETPGDAGSAQQSASDPDAGVHARHLCRGGFQSRARARAATGRVLLGDSHSAQLAQSSVESKLREYNRYGMMEITIHEAMPGHYVQFEFANALEPKSRRVLRSIYGNGPTSKAGLFTRSR